MNYQSPVYLISRRFSLLWNFIINAFNFALLAFAKAKVFQQLMPYDRRSLAFFLTKVREFDNLTDCRVYAGNLFCVSLHEGRPLPAFP